MRGEPLGATEAIQVLLGQASEGVVPQAVLDTLVTDDERFCWTDHTRRSIGLRRWDQEELDLLAVPFVALDLETTGARAGTGKITEIGAVRLEGMQIVEEFHTLVNPQRPIPPMIRHITGITEDMVADAPRIEEVMPGLLRLLQGAVVVAHNAPFDVGFLNYELHRLSSLRLGEGAIDTLPLSRALVPGLANYRLKTVAESLGSPVAACHRALADAQAVAHVFAHLAALLQSQGIGSLRGLRQCGRSSPDSALQKLPLTRDLPEGPGVFTFLGAGGSPLLVGSAEHLAAQVRSLFGAGAKPQKELRTAIRLVEKIDHESLITPLEAVVREHALMLEHRPPHGSYRADPEKYLYIKASQSSDGLALSATSRVPRWLRGSESSPRHATELIVGPFRRRASARAAVALMQDCYPISRCPRRRDQRPCERHAGDACLAPCTGAPDSRLAHDALVTDLMLWLAGQRPHDPKVDPLALADGTDGRRHLATIRRAYAGLAEAERLCFALVWPYQDDGRPKVRLNVVMGGRLRAAVSVEREGFDLRLSETLNPLLSTQLREPVGAQEDHRSLVAVPPEEVDCLLGIRRWFREFTSADHADSAIVSWDETSPDSIADAQARIFAGSRSLLGRR